MCLHSGCDSGGAGPNWWWELGPQPFVTIFWYSLGILCIICPLLMVIFCND